MRLTVRLLGTPSIEVDGVPARRPRGRKSWGLLAYLLLTDSPPSRQRLAALLFADADDPLGALRWSLAEIRRTLRPAAEIAGDPVTVAFAEGVAVEVDATDPGMGDSLALDRGELLEGMNFDGCEVYETWLLVERRRLGAAVEGVLHQDALRALAVGSTAEAVTLATHLVTRNPLDENHHELLVRALATAGDRGAALAQAEACEQLFRRELGLEPSPAVRRAVEVPAGSLSPAPHVGRAAARAQLDAGRAAIDAGAVDAGLDCLRRAEREADAICDHHLRVEALIELGAALVHSVRGRDEEGAAVLHEAFAEAQEHGDARLLARTCRELGFVDVQAGRRECAGKWLSMAASWAEDDHAELAAILGVDGMSLSDSARYPEALDRLTGSVEHALSADGRRQQAWSLSLIGRIHHLRGDQVASKEVLNDCLALVQNERWTAFMPWPETLRGDVDRAWHEPGSARDRYAHAYALACQLGDPCWEGMAARGLGLVEADAGELEPALLWLDDARARCTRWPDAYQWVHGAVLDATCGIALDAGDRRGPRWVDELAGLAARTGMRELVVRSHLHEARLDRPGALEAAGLGAADIDNAALAALVEGASHGL